MATVAADAPVVIRATIEASLAGLVERAAAIARARAATLALRDDPARWRRAGLLWPLFTKG